MKWIPITMVLVALFGLAIVFPFLWLVYLLIFGLGGIASYVDRH